MTQATHLGHNEMLLEKMTVTFPYQVCPFTAFQKDHYRVDHNIKGCKNLGQSGSKLSPDPKRDFFGKLITSLLPTY